MSDAAKPPAPVAPPPALRTPPAGNEDTVVCERCGRTNVYRMHAVWRCADCGYKTDCCGW
jgi:hypothetical protein